MKKKLVVALALALCVAIALPVAAVATGFVPSITYKGAPLACSAELITDKGDVLEEVGGCIVITSIEQAREKETDIMQEERDLLIEVYEKLEKGEMTLPIAEEHVIRELVDISFCYNGCRLKTSHGEKPESLSQKDILLKLTLDLGVEASAKMMVMTYINGEWTEIESVENNGNGTVTCVFEDICPVAFVVLG